MSVPEVSVLMSVRNGAAFLEQTLRSLSAQTLASVEFVAVDDGSTDETPKLLDEWAGRDPRVHIIRLKSDESNGLAHALNVGLESCRGDLIARADGDDLYHPDRLMLQQRRMRADPDLTALSCGFRRIDDDGHPMGDRRPLVGPEKIAFTTLFQSSLLHPGAMIRARALADVGGYDTRFWTAQDSDLWARLIRKGGRLDNLPELLVDYRVHRGSLMKKRGPEGQALSLSVPARMQADYLGGTPDGHDAAAVVALYQGAHLMDRQTLSRGLEGAERIMRAAQDREPAEVIAHAQTKFLASLERQLAWCPRRDLPLRLQLKRALSRWRKLPGATHQLREPPFRFLRSPR